MEAGDVGIAQSRGDLPAVHQIFGGADTQSESLGQFWIIKKLIGIAFVAFVGLMFCKLPPWLIVLGCALAGKLFLH
jgi:hypothetical protein